MRVVARAEAKQEIAVLKIMDVFLEKALGGRTRSRSSTRKSRALLHVTPPDLMFDRGILTMPRGLRLDRYAFPLLAIRSSQGRRLPLRVTRPTESAGLRR